MKRLDYFDVENLRFALEQFDEMHASQTGRKLSRDEFKILYKLHDALTDYLEFYDI